MVEPGAEVALDRFLARVPCFLKDHLRQFATRYLAHRPRSLLDAEDLVQEVVTRLLADPTLRHGGFGRGLPAFLGYLRQMAVRCAISAERSQRGRIRCGNCRNFASYSARCLAEGHTWTHRELPAAQDPRALEPPCREFQARREPVGQGVDAGEIAVAAPNVDVDRNEVMQAVTDALVLLATVHPRAALVVRARLLDGRTYEELTHVPASVRTMKRDFAFGMEFLRQRLASFGKETVARPDEMGRFRAVENADS